MPSISDAELRTLRLRYNAAHASYQSCVLALNEAATSGQLVNDESLAHETAALRALNEARAKFIEGMRKAAGVLSP